MSTANPKTQKHLMRKLYGGLIVLLFVLSALNIFGGRAFALADGPTCLHGLLCLYNTQYYTPSDPRPANCATNCAVTTLGRGDSITGFDQPVLQYLDDLTYNFRDNGGIKTIYANQTVNLQLGYNSAENAAGDRVITWTNIIGAAAISSITPTKDGVPNGMVRPCVRGGPSDHFIDYEDTYFRPGSPYGLGGNFSPCTDSDKSVSWVEKPFGVKMTPRYRVQLKFSSALTGPAKVCLRTHVSIMDPDPKYADNDPSAPIENTGYGFRIAADSDYANLMGIMGAGRSDYPRSSPSPGSSSPLCFNVLPVPNLQPPDVGVDPPPACPATITGFAYDLDDLTASTRVDVYVDGKAGSGAQQITDYGAAPVYANQLRPDATVGDNHGFSFAIPNALMGGSHTYYVYAIDGSNTVSGPGGGPGTWPPGQAYNGHVYGADPITVDTSPSLCGRYYSFDPIGDAQPTGTEENPGQINFSWGNNYSTLPPIDSETPFCVNGITVSYQIYKHPVGTPPSNVQTITSGSNGGAGCTGYNENPWTYFAYTPPSYEAGDSFCVALTINPSRGFAKADHTQVSVIRGEITSTPACVTIKNRPYFNVYGSGVSSGGDFSPVCGGNTGMLAGWSDNRSGTGLGAGTQLSALALVNIVGFSSGQNSSDAGVSYGLTFARQGLPPGTITTDAYSPKQGGLFGSTHCIQVPPEPSDAQPLPAPSYQIQSLPSLGKRSPYTHSGDLTINPSFGEGVNTGQNAAIFVRGDVYIANNIVYGSGWSVNNVPSLVIYATGNMFIDRKVTRLDGRYVALGKIYTCATGLGVASLVSPADMYAGCSNQLTVFGSFSATQINLMRTYGSLRNTGGAGSCSRDGGAIQSSSRGCASEVFDFSPEMYLAEPAVGPPTENLKQYESITSLPPVL